ncbi:MAG TPA: XRE family transcriptional regulator [Casimicrobiaceae bacterium]|nr:XRE family transcriptional regulator [Casimicrobiaceae bacterium]
MDKPPLVSRHLARNLAALRQVRSLTQEALAKAAGVPRSTIANLESGDGNPSLAVLLKVADALSTSIDELVASPRAKVRRWAAKDLASRSRGRGVTTRALVPEPVPEELMELMEFAPEAVMAGTPHLPGTREFFSCLQGRVTIFVAGERFELAAGDVLGFPGNVPHSYRNLDPNAHALGVSIVVLAKAGV